MGLHQDMHNAGFAGAPMTVLHDALCANLLRACDPSAGVNSGNYFGACAGLLVLRELPEQGRRPILVRSAQADNPCMQDAPERRLAAEACQCSGVLCFSTAALHCTRSPPNASLGQALVCTWQAAVFCTSLCCAGIHTVPHHLHGSVLVHGRCCALSGGSSRKAGSVVLRDVCMDRSRAVPELLSVDLRLGTRARGPNNRIAHGAAQDP
jgi:hypothetical protein